MKYSFRTLIWASFAFLAVAGTAEAAQPPQILAKPGGDFDQRTRDRARCKVIAANSPVNDLPFSGGGYDSGITAATFSNDPVAIGVGGAGAALVIAAIDVSIARSQAADLCMTNLGYVPLPLTDEEAGAYRGLHGGKRDTWERALLAQDLSGRIVAARHPVAAPLPDYRPEPGAQGGLRVDLASLVPAPAPVKPGEVLATGAMTRWRTAELVEGFQSGPGAVRIAAKPGAVFHQVDYRTQFYRALREPGARWCGPVEEQAGGTLTTRTYCFTAHDDGYQAAPATGYDWLAAAPAAGPPVAPFAGAIALRERAEDDLGPFTLKILLVRVGGKRLTLAGVAERNGERVQLWQRDLDLEPDGSTILPLWSRQLILTRDSAGSVRASLRDHADGHSWRHGED